jgi:hypothetical protein
MEPVDDQKTEDIGTGLRFLLEKLREKSSDSGSSGPM